MSNAKCHTRPYVAVRVVATARPAAWQRGSAAALEINENEGHSTPLSARPSGLRSVPGMQRVWAISGCRARYPLSCRKCGADHGRLVPPGRAFAVVLGYRELTQRDRSPAVELQST